MNYRNIPFSIDQFIIHLSIEKFLKESHWSKLQVTQKIISIHNSMTEESINSIGWRERQRRRKRHKRKRKIDSEEIKRITMKKKNSHRDIKTLTLKRLHWLKHMNCCVHTENTSTHRKKERERMSHKIHKNVIVWRQMNKRIYYFKILRMVEENTNAHITLKHSQSSIPNTKGYTHIQCYLNVVIWYVGWPVWRHKTKQNQSLIAVFK